MNSTVMVDSVEGTWRRGRRKPPEFHLIDGSVRDVPFIRVTPSGVQASVGRDSIMALGVPSHVVWVVLPPNPEEGRMDLRLRLVASSKQVPGSFALSYCAGRPTAMTTVPPELRTVLKKGKYWAIGWTDKNAEQKWVEFSPVSRMPLLEGGRIR